MSISRIHLTQHLDKAASHEIGGNSPQAPEFDRGNSFLQLVVDNNPDHPSHLRAAPSSLHRVARQRVFEKIINATLSHPGHPYAALARTPEGQKMKDAILDVMLASHFLRR